MTSSVGWHLHLNPIVCPLLLLAANSLLLPVSGVHDAPSSYKSVGDNLWRP